MDRNALLSTARTEFLRAFQDAVEDALASAMTATSRKAEFSLSYTEQRLLQDANRVLQDQLPEFKTFCQRQMEQLLNRSFQTAYSTFRPSFSTEFTSETLSLVESTHLEDQLRIDDITARFRNAGEQQLRDLNIRVALLFEQTAIKERENPFRPWLITRCIANAAQAVSNRAELSAVLSQQVAIALESSVAALYSRLNAYLAEHGIAAQLQLQARRPRGVGPVLAGGHAAEHGTGARIDAAALPQVPSAETARDLDAIARGSPRFVPAGPISRNGAGGAFNAQQPSDATLNAPNAEVSLEFIKRLARCVRRIAETEATLVNPPPDVDAQQLRDITAVKGHVDSNAGGWLAHSEGPAVTLRRFFAGEPALVTYGTAAPDARIEPRLDSRVDRSLSPALAQSLQILISRPPLAAVATAGAAHGTQWLTNQILEQRSLLASAAGDVSEQMTIDVVAMVFEFILHDKAIPAEARAQLGRLQFPVLKIALCESTLLTQNGHPTRGLINRIGTVSGGLRRFNMQGTRVEQEIVRIVDTLLCSNVGSSTPFLTMLDEFDAFIANEFRDGDANVKCVVDLIEDAQNRTARFTHIAAQLEEALSGVNLDVFLRRFLLADWVHVIERAEQKTDAIGGVRDSIGTTSGETTTGVTDNVVSSGMRYRLLVADLLWSIVPHADPESRTQLFKRLPAIVRTIREGLVSIGWSPQQQQPILDWLVDAHRNVLRGNPEAAPGPTLRSLRQHFDRFIKSAQPEQSAPTRAVSGMALQHAFLDEAICQSNSGLAVLDSVAVSGTAAAPSPRDGLSDVRNNGLEDTLAIDDASVLDLRVGVTIEFRLGDLARVALLKWVDQRTSTLVLAIEGQPMPSLLTVRMFRRMLADGRVRFVEAAPLFERAVESVTRAAAKLEIP